MRSRPLGQPRQLRSSLLLRAFEGLQPARQQRVGRQGSASLPALGSVIKQALNQLNELCNLRNVDLQRVHVTCLQSHAPGWLAGWRLAPPGLQLSVVGV